MIEAEKKEKLEGKTLYISMGVSKHMPYIRDIEDRVKYLLCEELAYYLLHSKYVEFTKDTKSDQFTNVYGAKCHILPMSVLKEKDNE